MTAELSVYVHREPADNVKVFEAVLEPYNSTSSA